MSLTKSENDKGQPIKPTDLDQRLLSKLQTKGEILVLPDDTIVELIVHTNNTTNQATNAEANYSLGYFTVTGETPVITTGYAPNLNTDSMFDCNLMSEQFQGLKNSEPVIEAFGRLGLDTSRIRGFSVGVNVVSGCAIPKK